MFTGIISHTTEIKSARHTNDGLALTFKKPKSWRDLQMGESVSTNGVCLTVAAIRENEYDCFLVPETLAKSIFGNEIPKCVNLERSMKVDDRFGGHFVQGHVDDVGRVASISDTDGRQYTIQYSKDNRALVIPKGSITINGVSLTVAQIDAQTFSVAVIPYTLQNTTLGSLKKGNKVNLEFDIFGKYIINELKMRRTNAES